MSKKESNYWPHFIIALVVFAIILGVWTVKTAIDNPVEMDNSYMMKYQDVDKNFYKIEKEKKEFDKRYLVRVKNERLKRGKNLIQIIVKDKNETKEIDSAQIELLLTRPETTKYDKKVKAKYVDGIYVAEVEIPKEGRWNIILKVTVGDLTRYFTIKLSTRRVMKKKA